MEVIIAENREKWDEWLKKNYRQNPLAQSWEWGNILLSEGKELERLAIIEEGKILAVAQAVYSRLPFGWQYAFCPMGPVTEKNCDLRQIYSALSEYFKNKKCVFFRIEPIGLLSGGKKGMFKKTKDINPPATVMVDLKNNTDDLLLAMHAKTRYNIHLAEKKNIVLENNKDFDIFWGLMKKTGARDNFKLHHEAHYRKVFSSENTGQIIAYFNNNPVACLVYFTFGNTFTYLYGASDYASRNLMAPHLLQWHAIQLAKHADYEWYDFFGIAPRINDKTDGYEYDPKHQYAGVTRFKLGFGGKPFQRSGTWDIIMSKGKYTVYNMLRAIRRWF